MQDAFRAVRPWLTFGGCVLVVAVLYWAQAVLVPIALAVLLTFVLSPAVTPIQRRLGSVPAVLLVVVIVFGALGVAGWAVTTQLTSLVQELPSYRQNVRQKIRDVRWMGRGGSVETLQDTVEDIQAEIDKGAEPRGTTSAPVVVESERVGSLWGLPTAIASWLEPLATTGLVMALVIFMLLERQELRNRFISLIGHGHLAVTTRAFDEAGRRVSRYLLTQAFLNTLYGVGVAAGLYVIGVPYVILWASLAAVLRFVPYVGPWIAAIAPVLVSLAAFPGWTEPLLVAALYAGLELLMNLVVESFFYAGAAGVSQVGLLVAFTFWTWLWGPLGLVMATPLTVCLVVLGKYVPGVEFIATLMADTTTLESDVGYYQRLLAGDRVEAAELIEQHLKTQPAETLYDALMIPALNYGERDRIEGRLSAEEERAIVEATRDILEESEVVSGVRDATAAAADPIPILGWSAQGESDAVALRMLGALLKDTPVVLEIAAPAVVSEAIRTVQESGVQIVCIADLPPSGPSKSRYLVKRLRAAVPGLSILVGRWAPPAFADDSVAVLREAGADEVATTLVETRDQLLRVLHERAAEPPSGSRPLEVVVGRGV